MQMQQQGCAISKTREREVDRSIVVWRKKMAKVVLSLALLLSLMAASSAEEFDFFYLVQQWPGSYCNTWRGCCFPDTGKPAADFGIHGLWPNYAKCRSDGALDGGFLDMVGRRGKCWPQYCNDDSSLNPWDIKDLVKELEKSWPTLSCKSGRSLSFWTYEWKKHGTCSDMEPHAYFAAALKLKAKHNLTKILAAAGIVPSEEESYYLSSIRDAIREGTGFKANLECNRGADSGESQLYQVYQCVDRTGTKLIDCPLEMTGKCDDDKVKLPLF